MTEAPGTRRAGLHAMTRNNYFHGQLLGVENFDRELAYLNGHRRQLTRTVSGTGVVCGLDVELDPTGTKVLLTPGLAVDRWGREIVVPRRPDPDPVPIPAEAFAAAVDDARTCPYDPTIQVVICYHECRSDPAPSLAGDCDTPDPCAPSCVREQYRIDFRPGPAPRPNPELQVRGLLANGRLDYADLATWVTRDRSSCTAEPSDPCLVLANIVLAGSGDCGDPARVDITVRRVLLSSAALLQLVLAAVAQDSASTDSDY